MKSGVGMDIAVNEICNLFGNPSQWSTGQRKMPLPGSDRPHVFHLSHCSELSSITTALEAAKIHSVAIIGINPIAFLVGLALKKFQFKISLVASGLESSFVIAHLQTDAVTSFFERHGIILHPHAAKSLRGSQVHCQSGYCGFVCEGRFIKESDEVGCIITERGNVYADAAIIVET